MNINQYINQYMNSSIVQDGTRIKSTRIKLDEYKETKYDINLIYQYFIPTKSDRFNEIKNTLYRNVMNKYITKIYLLNERIYTTEELGIKSDKIIQIVIGKWLKFKDVFSFVDEFNINGYIIMTNSDIFLDDTISKLHYTDLDKSEKMICLLRWEYRGEDNLNKCKIFGPRWDSQDTWIFHSNYKVEKKYHEWFDFSFGQPGCDNKIIYLLLMLGIELNNDPVMFKTYHYHMEINRNYSKKPVPSPYGYLIPESVNFETTQNSHYDYKHMVNFTQNYTKWNFVDDNKLIKKICNIHISLKRPVLFLDIMDMNTNDNENQKYIDSCSGFFICEPYSKKINNYKYFYKNNNKQSKKQLFWYKLQNTLHNSYNKNNNWMSIYNDMRILFITQDTKKQELLYKNGDTDYMNVFVNKDQRFIEFKYDDKRDNKNNNSDIILELMKNVKKEDNIDVVYIDIHPDVNNKIAYTIWNELKISSIILTIKF